MCLVAFLELLELPTTVYFALFVHWLVSKLCYCKFVVDGLKANTKLPF